MFLFGLKGRAERVLLREFAYPLNPTSALVFEGICSEAKRIGANEYDSAIGLMLFQMDMLVPGVDDVKVRSFIEDKTERMLRIAFKGALPSVKWVKTLNQIRAKHGLPLV